MTQQSRATAHSNPIIQPTPTIVKGSKVRVFPRWTKHTCSIDYTKMGRKDRCTSRLWSKSGIFKKYRSAPLSLRLIARKALSPHPELLVNYSYMSDYTKNPIATETWSKRRRSTMITISRQNARSLRHGRRQSARMRPFAERRPPSAQTAYTQSGLIDLESSSWCAKWETIWWTIKIHELKVRYERNSRPTATWRRATRINCTRRPRKRMRG